MRAGRRFAAVAALVLAFASSGGGGASAAEEPIARNPRPAVATWRDDLRVLATTANASERAPLVARVLAAQPDWRELSAALAAWAPPPLAGDPGGGDRLLLRDFVGRDGRRRPWVLGVPAGYDRQRPTPLLVVLHGGVSYEDAAAATVASWAAATPFWQMARARGWLLLYPFGQDGAAWWDTNGIDNVLQLLREVKREANVDDDRVWLAGFSDGATGALAQAMLVPTDYAAVIAANGHLAGANIDGNLPTYVRPLVNVPVLAINTNDDPLFPTRKMRPLLAMAQAAGGRVQVREFAGGHDTARVVGELPALARFLERHPRDPLPPRIEHETADAAFGRCRWLAITALTPESPAPWHDEPNAVLPQDRVELSFVYDERHQGRGVGVRRVFPDTVAATLGLMAGDVVTALASAPVTTVADFEAARSQLRRGDPVTITVQRAEGETVLRGRLPRPVYALAFRRELISGVVRARASGNRVVLETSRVAAVRLFIHPDQFDLDRPITVTVNGQVRFAGLVHPDPDFMVRNYLAERDRHTMYVNVIDLDLETPASQR